MDKKICVITGANAGIGKAAAIQIASGDYYVIIGCRDKKRGESAESEIKEKSKSDTVEFIQVDMSLKKSIKEFSSLVKNKFGKVDIIIHNAAAFDMSQKRPLFTEEGIESIWSTNHVGPVFLTNSLLPELKQSPQGRIITVASQGLALHPSLKINMQDPEFRNHNFSVSKAYYQSKLAQVMYTYWLSEKLKSTNITVNSIRVTNVKIDIKRYPNISSIYKFLYKIKSGFSITPDVMAEVYTYLATSKEVEGITGKYFDHHKKYVQSSKYSYIKENIDGLMKLTEKYLE
jgi:NAD(P)-dependent dehydrogenase (short-subunit alcohol dehydrogenase family)